MTDRPAKKTNSPVQKNGTHTTAGRKRRLWAMRLTAVFLAIFCTLLVAEIAVRIIGRTDDDGNVFVLNQQIGTRHPQANWVSTKIEEYRGARETRMIYDPHTAWSPRPNSDSHAGMYHYNSRGIRSALDEAGKKKEYRQLPTAGKLRIALFGDSFTHGDDVPLHETWGDLLEKQLIADGISAEVINFGVSAYGMDQAFLRWRQLGKQFSPHIVLFGFQAENVNRNVNLLRGFYMQNTGIPFSKPRFHFDHNGTFQVANFPTLPIETVPEIMRNMDDWEHADKEWFYSAEQFEQRFWHRSRLLSLLVERWGEQENFAANRRKNIFAVDAEPAKVTRKILQQLQQEVTANNAQFFIVHLPRQSDLRLKLRKKQLPYSELLQGIQKTQTVIDPLSPLQKLAAEKSLDRLFVEKKQHYSIHGHRIIAETILQFFNRNKTISKKFSIAKRFRNIGSIRGHAGDKTDQ